LTEQVSKHRRDGMSEVHICKYCYSNVYGHNCEQCKRDHEQSRYKLLDYTVRKKGSPTLDRQEGNREEYFGDSSE
jgi:hypothetical protein